VVTVSGCETCDQIGPDITRTISDLRDVHRAMHDIGRIVMADVLEPALRWIDKALARTARTPKGPV